MSQTDEEIDLDLTNESGNEAGRADKRFKDLSEKVRTTAQERDELADAKAKAEAEAGSAKKEVEFYKNFTPLTAKYSGAGEFQDQILEKVKAGYDVEDATVAVLNKEGRLQGGAVTREPESAAGGSATTTIKGGGEKSIADMTQAEKLDALRQEIG